MKLFKNICLIVFAIITILFTVGYTTQPIVSNNSTNSISTPTGDKYEPNQFTFYIANDFKRTYTENTDYTSLSNNKKLIFQSLLYMCIGITILLSLSIIISLFGLKLVSKILLFITLILMIIVFLIIQFAIVADSLVNMAANMSISKPSVSNGTGYYLILVSTILMFVNYIIYVILGICILIYIQLLLLLF